MFWQLVPVTRWAPCLEETPVIRTQEGVSANASPADTTVISVGYDSEQLQFCSVCEPLSQMYVLCSFLSTATALGSVQ